MIYNFFFKRECNIYTSASDILGRGTRVEARLGGGISYFPGTVTRAPYEVANTDATYGIQYDNGAWEPSVLRTHIRHRARTHAAATAQTDPRRRSDWATTSALKSDTSEQVMRRHLMEDLGLGSISVTRTAADAQGGYQWTVTFASFSDVDVPEMDVNTDDLTGAGAHGYVDTVSTPPHAMHGAATLFTVDPATETWTQQATLNPSYGQGADLFGLGGVAITDRYAAVGAPNRDTVVSGVNGGAGFIFDYGLVNLKFAQKAYEVYESAGTLNVTVLRCGVPAEGAPASTTPHCHTSDIDRVEWMEFMTGDGNGTGLQAMVDPPLWNPYGEAACNASTHRTGCASSATGRRTCQLRSKDQHECQWLPSDGSFKEQSQFDFRGFSDYAPEHSVYGFVANDTAARLVEVVVTDDHIFERPDETINVRLLAPGIEPVFGGDLWTVVTIKDDGDGAMATRSYQERLTTASRERDGYGEAVAISGSAMIVGSPAYSPDHIAAHHAANQSSDAAANDPAAGINAAWYDARDPRPHNATTPHGAAFVYFKTSGYWGAPTILLPPTPDTHAADADGMRSGHFGQSVDIYTYSWNGGLSYNVTCVVGAPGLNAAYVYAHELNASGLVGTAEAARGWTLEAILTWNGTDAHHGARVGRRNPDANHRFAGTNAVAIFGDFIVVGAPGQEIVYVFRRNAAYRDAGYATTYAHGSSTSYPGIPASEGGRWARFQALRTRDYHEVLVGPTGLTYVTRADFGCSVDIWDDTIVIGAETADYGSQARTAADDADGVDQRPTEHRYTARGAVYVFIYVNGTWQEQTTLQAADKQAADRFGHAVALEHDQLVVGTPGDELKARTTWNFETGNLVGWTQTGTAFLHQPTKGDNTNSRFVYGRIISTGFSYTYHKTVSYWGQGGFERGGAEQQAAGERAAGGAKGHDHSWPAS